jgi:hypothetical protein
MWLNDNQHPEQDGVYIYVDSELAHLCRERFIELGVIVNNITGTNELPYSPPPPYRVGRNRISNTALLRDFFRT